MATVIDGARFYSLQEVADQVSISRQTLWRWRQEGRVPKGHRHRGRQVLFSERELELVWRQVGNLSLGASSVRSEIYLDNAATTQPLSDVRDAIGRSLDLLFGNASSAHARGAIARTLVEESREAVAGLCGSSTDRVFFTSGCTEANNWVLLQRDDYGRRPWKRVITSKIEHSSVLASAQQLEREGVAVSWLPVDSSGRITAELLDKHEIDNETLVSIQWANNETGVIHEVEKMSQYVKTQGGFFHSDGAQIFGKKPICFDSSLIDYLTITGHKIHGPQGCGAVIKKPEAPLYPRQLGGTQEKGMRGGTENTPGIVGFGTAASQRQSSLRSAIEHCRSLRDYLENELRSQLDNFELVGDEEHRVCFISNFRIRGLDGQALVAQLDTRGIQVSQSSACTNMRPEPSYVLREMGYSEDEAFEALRVGIGVNTSIQEVMKATEVIVEIANSMGMSCNPSLESASKE